MGALVPAGKITKLFGDGGEVVISLYDTFPADIDIREEPLFVSIDSLTVPLFLYRFERRGQSGAVAGIDDIDTARRAEMLIGLELLVRRSAGEDSEDSPADEDIYMEDFVGFAVKFKRFKVSGEVSGFIESDQNPLFSISVEGKEVLVPATNDFIANYNLCRRELTFDVPEGLLELYLE